MKRLLLIVLFLPLLFVSQTASGQKPKPKTTTATAKKPTGTVKKPAVAKKPNPKVVQLTEKAYTLYSESNDVECEKVIKQILALDPKNKDAFLLRANIAMFEFKYDAMWLNLDKIYKYNPNEPEVYSNFAMTHLNYYFLSDSLKQILCRKTIRLAGWRAEGYAALGMVHAVSGYYYDAISCFEISLGKPWKDSMSRVIIDLPYANCLYSVGDTLGALERLDKIIPRMSGRDKYTCVFLRVKYKLEMNNLDVAQDLDTLNNYSPNQPDILSLDVKYLGMTNRKDSACKLARIIRLAQNGEMFDMSPYCDDLVKTIDITKIKNFTYAIGDEDMVLHVNEFVFPLYTKFTWERGVSGSGSAWKKGNVHVRKTALDSSYLKAFLFDGESDVTLDKAGTFWLSNTQFCEIEKDSTTKLYLSGSPINGLKFVGHEQVDVFDSKNNTVLLDCLVLTDGTNKVCYLNDQLNPMIVKLETDKISFVLIKIE